MIKDNWVWVAGLNNFPFNITKIRSPYAAKSVGIHGPQRVSPRLAETLDRSNSILFDDRNCNGETLANSTVPPILDLPGVTRSFCGYVGSILPRFVYFYHYLNLFLQLSVILAIAQVLGNLEENG